VTVFLWDQETNGLVAAVGEGTGALSNTF